METNREIKLRKHYSSGELVVLDKGFTNESIVTVVYQTQGQLYTRVKDEITEWEVMTYRLTEIYL